MWGVVPGFLIGIVPCLVAELHLSIFYETPWLIVELLWDILTFIFLAIALIVLYKTRKIEMGEVTLPMPLPPGTRDWGGR